MPDKPMMHPIQFSRPNPRKHSFIPEDVALAAYEVYCAVYSEQKALITGNCRGGFGVGELIAFLYARSFPKDEWKARAHKALLEMENL